MASISISKTKTVGEKMGMILGILVLSWGGLGCLNGFNSGKDIKSTDAPSQPKPVVAVCEDIPPGVAAWEAWLVAFREHAAAVLQTEKDQAAADRKEAIRLATQNALAVKNSCDEKARAEDPCRVLVLQADDLAKEALNSEPGSSNFSRVDNARTDLMNKNPNCFGNAAAQESAAEEAQNEALELCRGEYDRTVNETSQSANRNFENTVQAAQKKHDDSVYDAQRTANAEIAAIRDLWPELCETEVDKTDDETGIDPGFGGGKSDDLACTGNFSSFDGEMAAQIGRLASRIKQYQAAGLTGNIADLREQQQKLEKEMAALGGTTCRKDMDCGDVKPKCCGTAEVGKVVCEKGVIATVFGMKGLCAAQKDQCSDGTYCKDVPPAMCVGTLNDKTNLIGSGVQNSSPEKTVTVPGMAYPAGKLWLIVLFPQQQFSGLSPRHTDQSCVSEHYHGTATVVKTGKSSVDTLTTDDQIIANHQDPDPNGCGWRGPSLIMNYSVSENLINSNSTLKNLSARWGGGNKFKEPTEMIKIDPPTLRFPG